MYETKILTTRHRRWQYAIWSPPALSGPSLPVILFLHGAGERGSDGHTHTTVGLGPALSAFPERYPAHVVMPQCPLGSQWSGAAEEAALCAVEDTIAATGADERRVYITGISMGGHGALHIAARHS